MRHSRAVHFVGLDLAWGQRKPTGVAVVDDSGRLVPPGLYIYRFTAFGDGDDETQMGVVAVAY